jgi:hypothetical protein
MSGSGRADRSARLRNLNHDPLSRHCRFSGLLSLDSRPVTGNSVRRAGSNSPRRSGPRQSFGAGQGQIAFIVSLGALRVPRLGAGEPERLISPAGVGALRHSVGHNLRIWARLRRRRSRFRNVFHVVPYAAPAEAGRRSFEELSIWAPR